MRTYRKERVASLVREIVSQAIAQRLHDPRVEALTTVTRVEMSGDLEVAKVLLAVPGGEVAERLTLRAIRHAGGFLQRIVAQELTMRQCPELRFEIDDAVKIAKETMELLAENRRKQPQLFEPEGDGAEQEGTEMDGLSEEDGGNPPGELAGPDRTHPPPVPGSTDRLECRSHRKSRG